MQEFTLMILAAGYGTRMGSLTKKIPKPLIKINNLTLLENTIFFFENIGCKKFIINTHYLSDKIKFFIKKKYPDKNIIINYEENILDTGGGIKNSIKFFEEKNILVTNSDTFWRSTNNNDVKRFVKDIYKINHCSLLLVNKKNSFGLDKEEGDFILDKKLLKRWKKNNKLLFFSGLQIINTDVFKLTKRKKFSMNLIWDKLIKARKLEGNLMKSEWINVNDCNAIKKINNSF